MLKGKEVATSQLRSSVTRTAEKLRGLDWWRLTLFNANKREPAYCIHLVLAALFFSPFLLFGHVVAASTDSLLESNPSLLLARHDFFQHSLGLWNPYVFSGMPRAAEAVPALLSPEHLILFLVPLRYLFATITFFAFVKFWLIGVAAYHFYCAELLQRRWALFASIAFQLSGMTIWLLGVYVSGLSLMLFYVILLALIWTSARRTGLANYLLWSLVTTLMLMSGDIALSCYALLAAGILFLYRTFSRIGIEPVFGRLALFTASSLTGLAIFSIRLLPTLSALQTSSAENCCLPEFNNSTFLIARYFDTEILGVHFDASIEFFRNMSHLFDGYHLHFAAPQFFGIAAALLALWMLASEKKTLKAVFWSIYVIVGLASLTHVQPFEFFVQYLLYPIGAVVGMQILFMVGVPALAALGGMSLEQCVRRARFPSLTFQLLGFALVVIAMFILMILVGNIYPAEGAEHNWPRVLVIGLGLFCALILWANYAYPALLRASALPILIGISVAAVFVILLWTDSNPTYLSHLKNIAVQLLLFSAVALVLVLISRDRSDKAKQFGLWGSVILVPVCLFVMLYPWTEMLRVTVPHEDGLILAGLGALRFALGVAILFLVLRLAQSRRLPSRGVYIVFMILLVAEQVPAGKIDSHVGDNPFYSNPLLYPRLRPLLDADNQPVDVADYRINAPNALLRLQFIFEIFGPTREPCADTNVAYGIRSYGGYIDVVPDRLVQFIRNWTTLPGSLCIWANLTDNRLLDLFAVGYQYDSKSTTIIRRPSALSRFVLFTKFDVAPGGDSALQILKGSDFDPRQKIVLQADPGFDSYPSSVNGRRLAYTDIDSDHAKLRVQTDRPAVLLFDDSFDSGWKATVNGQSQRVIMANYNFMAIPIPAGESNVVLEYRPLAFRIGAICAAAGLIVMALAFAVYLVRRRAGRPGVAVP
jgi:Bacterial membrane protein YfhO